MTIRSISRKVDDTPFFKTAQPVFNNTSLLMGKTRSYPFWENFENFMQVGSLGFQLWIELLRIMNFSSCQINHSRLLSRSFMNLCYSQISKNLKVCKNGKINSWTVRVIKIQKTSKFYNFERAFQIICKSSVKSLYV